MSRLPDHSRFTVPAEKFWAKLHPRKDPTEWHPLIAHSADVAAVMERLLRPDSVIARRLAATLGLDTLAPRQRAQMVFWAALHDIGKTSHGFQSKAGRLPEDRRWKNLDRGHVQVLLQSTGYPPLRDLLRTELLPHLGNDSREASDILRAIISHHGRPYAPSGSDRQYALWKPDSASDRDPLGEMRRILAHALTWSGLPTAEGDPLPPGSPAFTHLFAGALTLADWIGSTRGAFPLTPGADTQPERYWTEEAQPRAADACARIGVVPRTVAVNLTGLPLLAQLFPDVFGGAPQGELRGNTPTDLQLHVGTMPPPEPGTRLLIESETGSGKTEAALALYARLRAAGLAGGLMFALPTRATASAMYERVRAALAGIYPDGERPTVALAVGGQQPRAESNEPLVRQQPDTYPDEAELESWASSHNKKFLAAEIVVGTVDQVLLGGLPVKHAHLRLAALSRHLLVVDELHSYDRYMAEVLRRVLELHTAAGGISLFMSATLSDAARTQFARDSGSAPGDAQMYSWEAAYRAVPYPALATLAPGAERWTFYALASQGTPKTVEWRVTEREDARAQAITAARAGARVLVLCNTVRRARDEVRALRDAGHTALLWQPPGADPDHTPPYHSRYTLPDRLALDAAVTERFGKTAATTGGGTILVATQVAEQSLDVDFDLLVTDLAPVDVLLQRIGRLHRHPARDAYRPDGYRAPRVLVIGPEGGSFASHLEQKAIDLGWGEQRPYRHFADGELTLRAIAANPRITIPADNRRLVEAVYHADAREPLWADPAWDRKMLDTVSAERNLGWMGEQAALDFGATYTANASAFNAAQEQKIRTRIGDETVRIELPEPLNCWYSQPAERVLHADLPAWALPPRSDDEAELPSPIWVPEGDVSAFRLGARLYRYGAAGWEWRHG
jgi:CRISPR-associated endonuclease/helicase Cas3